MESKEYLRYNAFISYRHADLDKFVAENLHRLIETYKMPKAVVEKYKIYDNDIRRVFRDKEELPLSPNLEDPIVEAIKSSEFLIVICSPRLKESLWCKKEIETFIKYHNRNDILCVLVEGEPEESFPEELLYYEEKTKNKAGKTVTKKVPCEPLALDVRGSNKIEVYRKLKEEIVRVMAPLYRLNYDDIKRRHEERELKRKANIFKIAAITCLIFAIYSFILFSKIYVSSKQLKQDQSISLAKEAYNMYKNHDRTGAIEKAYQSVTKYNKIKMPVTSEGIYELTNSLGLYQPNSSSYLPISQINTLGIVEYIKKDKEGKYLLTHDDAGELVLWDLKKEKRIISVLDTKETIIATGDESTFIGTKAFAYINNKNEAVIISLKGKKIKSLSLDYAKTITSSKNGKYLVIASSSNIDIYETDNYKLVSSYKASSGIRIIDNQYIDNSEEYVLFSTSKEGSNTKDNDLKISAYSIKDKKVISTLTVNAYTAEKILFNNNDAYVLANRNKNTLSGDMLVISYNFKTGKINYQNEYKSTSGKDIAMSFTKDGDGTLAVVDYDTARVLDLKTGKLRSANTGAGNAVYTETGVGAYRFYTKTGTATQMNNSDGLYDEQISMIDYFGTGIKNYKTFLYTSVGYLGVPNSDNRVIIYGRLENKEIKEIEYKEQKFETIEKGYRNDIVKEYKLENSGLISNMFYSDNKGLLFVVYNHNVMEVYNNKNKKLLNTIDGISKYTKYYVGKTNDGEYLVKTENQGGYVLTKKYEKRAFIPDLYDYKKGKVITKDYKNYYEMKLYTNEEIIKKGKEYLKSKNIKDA